ncbi:MAG: hypothetical protein ACLU9S_08725 [Oscillospiraceae bacterium]
MTGWSSAVQGQDDYDPCVHYGEALFQHRGYRVPREQQVIRGRIALTNYVMERSREATCQEEI